MNKLNDTDLREALRRRETKRTQVEVPADFCDRVMQETETKPSAHRWHIALPLMAIAASIALLVVMTRPKAVSTPPESHAVTAQKLPTLPPEAMSITLVSHEHHARKPRASRPKATSTKPESHEQSETHDMAQNTPKTDSLEYYISKVEQNLANIRDSCYEAHVERLIRADNRLQQLVNQLILDGIIADTLRSIALTE